MTAPLRHARESGHPRRLTLDEWRARRLPTGQPKGWPVLKAVPPPPVVRLSPTSDINWGEAFAYRAASAVPVRVARHIATARDASCVDRPVLRAGPIGALRQVVEPLLPSETIAAPLSVSRRCHRCQLLGDAGMMAGAGTEGVSATTFVRASGWNAGCLSVAGRDASTICTFIAARCGVSSQVTSPGLVVTAAATMDGGIPNSASFRATSVVTASESLSS